MSDSLFDAAEGIRRRDHALHTVYAPEAWKGQAIEAVEWCARMRIDFTTDDVWQRMLRVNPDSSISEPRALGAVMRSVPSIVPTGDYRPSQRPEAHRRPVRVWRRK